MYVMRGKFTDKYYGPLWSRQQVDIYFHEAWPFFFELVEVHSLPMPLPEEELDSGDETC
jgi:hypothetical protein